MRTRPTARRWSPATIRKSRPSRPIAKSTMPAPGDASAFATDTETSPHRPPCRPDTGSEPRNAREGRSPSHKPIHHRTCDGADADARNRRDAQSQIGRSLNFALSHGYANTTRRTGPWVPTGRGPENAGARRDSGTPVAPCRGCRKRQVQVLPGEEAASGVSEAAASLFGCSGRAFRAANRLGVCVAPEQAARWR